jgi:phage gpG-like protein
LSDETVKLDTRGLDRLIKSLKGEIPEVQVGILGAKDKRTIGAANSNAAIGAKHEYGGDGMPIRSFLRMPLKTRLSEYLEKAGAFDKVAFAQVVKEASLITWMKKIGVVAETVISDAFATGGFGKWKRSNMKFKKVKQTLVETQQLRGSISSRVK